MFKLFHQIKCNSNIFRSIQTQTQTQTQTHCIEIISILLLTLNTY